MTYAPLTSLHLFPIPEGNLMFGGDLIAREFFDRLFSPRDKDTMSAPSHMPLHSISIEPNSKKRKETHISPKATMQIVCQTPNPMRGVTPRYKPFNPLLP